MSQFKCQFFLLLFISLIHKECVLEVGDRDDDQQVKSCSEQSDEGQQNVNQHGLKVRTYWLPAGAVEELWKAEVSFL